MCEHHYMGLWVGMTQVWPKNKCRSLWPIFHDPVVLPYILKIIWYINTILWDYESAWPHVWPQNKCRSLWPIIHGPVILPYILKSNWYMNTILWDYDLCFIVHWFCLISLYLMDECHTFGKWVSVIWSRDLSFFNFCSEKHFSFISKARFRRAMLSCDSSYFMSEYFKFLHLFMVKGIFRYF